MSTSGDTTPLEADFVALRKLRDDDESGALKEFFGDGEDPREWKDEDGDECVTVRDGRVTELSLYQCTKLTALPAAIGKLGTLTELNLRDCSSLTSLPAAIGGLGALTNLILNGCSSLTALPAAIGELGALTELNLNGCSSLEKLPDAIAAREGLTVELPVHLIPDLVTLRKLRDDDASGALKEYFGDGEDPREWKEGDGDKVVTVKDGRVTKLVIYKCENLAALPDAIGELGALTELSLDSCSSLAALPSAIGELGALTKLDLGWCSSLAALPAAIGELKALTKLVLRVCVSLTELPAAIGELKALTTLSLSGCETLAALPDAIGGLKALTYLSLRNCSSLVELPDAIGELKALTTLDLDGCSNLIALPESIGGLDALEKLDLRNCPKLVFPPGNTHGDVKRVKCLLANTTRFLANKISAADADEEAKADFLEVIKHAHFADRLEEVVREDPALADLTNDKGQRAIQLACVECRDAMKKALMFLGRYEIADGPPEHRSATSLVVRAVDATTDYGKLFDEFDKDNSGVLDAGEIKALAANLGTTVETFKLADGESYTRGAFVARFGKERKVVIKIFQVDEQWRNEKKARDDQQLDAQFVVQTIEAPGDEEFTKALGESALFKEKRFGGTIGSRAIVMDAADRNLFQIYQSERPDLNKVRVLMQETMECVQHLHEKGLVHGDIKMLNVVRLSLDNKLRLIDLDAAAKISAFGSGDVSYVGSKFSSAVLPPECFAKLDADQVGQFEAYFEDVKDEELRKKVAPKVDKRGVSCVVKTFSLTEDGAPKRIDSLPYELVEASEAVDYWSLGALLFQLVTKESIVPANLDDDCVDGNAMAALASWNDDVGKKRLVAIKDAAAFDLASKLLVRDPEKRATFSITDTLARHPFFNPESDNAEIKKQLDEMQTTLNSVKADTSSILTLSEENRDELQLTRRVLLKAVFEATEVTTPTTFVVLTKKLPPAVTPEQQNWIDANVVFKDDGSGVDIKGKPPQWFLDIEARFKDGMAWANKLATYKPKDILTPANFSSAIKNAFDKLLPTKTLYFYLVDELTGEPIKGKGYPIEITKPAEQVSKLLPVMQVGMHAMSAYQGVAGVARMFGYPLPLVPEKWRKTAQGTVDLLKQESSVAAFGAINEKVKDKDEANQTVRGESLRELVRFFEAKDKEGSYAGLRRIGDPSDGTAVWTLLTNDEDVEKALAERATQRRGEEAFRRKDIEEEIEKTRAATGDAMEPASLVTPKNSERTEENSSGKGFEGEPSLAPGPVAQAARNAALTPAVSSTSGGAAPTTTQPAPQEQIINEALVNALAKANGGTCSNNCHCAIA